jgi:hypothetical protein
LRNAPRKTLGLWLPRSALSRPIRELLGGLAAAARPVAPAIAGRGKPRPYRTSRGRTLLGLRLFDDQVSFISAGGNDSAAQYFRDYARWIARTVHAVFSKLVGGQALLIKSAKAALVAKQRPASHGHATCKQDFDRCIQPDNRYARGAQKFGGADLRIRAAAKSEYDRFVKLENAPESDAQLVGLDLAKSRLAKALEYFRDAQSRSLLDAIVEIDKAPRQLTREQCADGGFARAHEAGEAEHLYARLSRT